MNIKHIQDKNPPVPGDFLYENGLAGIRIVLGVEPQMTTYKNAKGIRCRLGPLVTVLLVYNDRHTNKKSFEIYKFNW